MDGDSLTHHVCEYLVIVGEKRDCVRENRQGLLHPHWNVSTNMDK